jgi:hypothetical protein
VNSSTLGIPCTIGNLACGKSTEVAHQDSLSKFSLWTAQPTFSVEVGLTYAHISKWCWHTNMIKPLQRHCFLGAWMYQKAVNFILSDSVAMNYVTQPSPICPDWIHYSSKTYSMHPKAFFQPMMISSLGNYLI